MERDGSSTYMRRLHLFALLLFCAVLVAACASKRPYVPRPSADAGQKKMPAQAKIEKKEGRSVLARSREPRKDQTYFLHAIKRERLERIRFPLADLMKDEVRQIARKNCVRLPLRKKREHRLRCRAGMQRIRRPDIFEHPQTAMTTRNLGKTNNPCIGFVVAG